ncbi:unnamed protein product [Lepidochelys olivacea]
MADTAQNGPMQGGAGGGAVLLSIWKQMTSTFAYYAEILEIDDSNRLCVARGVCFSLSFTIDFLRCVIPPVEIHTAGLFSQS